MVFVTSTFLCLQVYCLIYNSAIATDVEAIEVSNKPVNLTIGKVTNTTIHLSWNRPGKPSGDILGYQLHYMYESSYHATKNVNVTSAKVHYTLSNLSCVLTTKTLAPNTSNNSTGDTSASQTSGGRDVDSGRTTPAEPFTEYKIWVESSIMGDGDNGSEHSEEIKQCTDVSGPGPPRITNVTCLPANNSFYVQWQKPIEFFNTIDMYFIYYKSVEEKEFEEIRFEPYIDDLGEIVGNLQDNTIYEVKVSGASRSVLNSKSLMHGVSSAPKKVFIKSDCDQPDAFEGTNKVLNVVFVTIVVFASFAIFFTICAVAIWRHCFHAAYYYLEESRQVVSAPAFDWDAKNDQFPPIPVIDFSKHVASLHADGDIGFSKEYDSIQCASLHDQFSSDVSTHPENKLKNRYLNILAYDHSRVRLMAGPSQNRWVDYINANYIDGFEKINAYIGTQGPLPNTFDCFWRMIWEQGVSVIVMITNLVERGRRKCDMYWPKEGIETYGHIQVKLVKEDVLAMYTVRTMKITHLKAKRKKYTAGERLVHQFHYTNWHDHGTPDHPLPILSFVSKSSVANEGTSGPIVVHCSAGVGRTGTYIVLDAMLKQIRAKKEVNIYGYLRYIRNQRNYLVQTEEQYIFIHDAILEAITFAENTLSTECLHYILQPNVDTNSDFWLQFESNYKMVTAFEAKDYNHISANKICNLNKNRSQEFVPLENSRVHLTPKPGIEGSDYINASWFLGFKKLKEFIITQHPLEQTIIDFWQMVWDHNAQTIVLLSAVDEAQGYPPFWPSEKNTTLDSDNFKVKSIEESELDGTVSRDFTIQSLHDDYELTVRIIQPSHTITEITDIIQLITIVQHYHLEYQNGPIVVVDELGGTVSASFCCLTTLMKQLEYDSHADVSIYAKLYHNRIPGVWKTIDRPLAYRSSPSRTAFSLPLTLTDDYLVLYKGLNVITTNKGVSLIASPSYVNSS